MIAVDIGNSRLKMGLFHGLSDAGESELPRPMVIGEFAIDNRSGRLDAERFSAWCDAHVRQEAAWWIASVHSGAATRLTEAINHWAQRSDMSVAIRRLAHEDVSLPIEVDEPARVGMDRLMGAVAAERLRTAGRAAVTIDLGSAITVDLLTAAGAFAGGAILPGIAMSARALAEQTDALPQLPFDRLEKPPAAVGKSTAAAIEAGLFWGAVGAIRELVEKLSRDLTESPEVFLTGGASPQVADLLSADWPVKHVPHLVLAGIAITAGAVATRGGPLKLPGSD